MDKIKSIAVKTIVLIINAALVTGGVFYFKNQQQKKQAARDLAANAQANDSQQQIADVAGQLQQIVDQNRNASQQVVQSNPATVTVQKPVTTTQIIPAKTATVKVPAGTSSSSSSSSKTTTKTS